MFCANCGKKIEGEGYICPQCATQLTAAEQQALYQACGGGVPPVAPAAPVYEAPAAPVYEAPVAPAAPAAPVYEAPAAPVYEAPAAPVNQQSSLDYNAPVYEAPVYTAPAAPTQPTPGFTLSAPADGVKKSGKKNKGLFIGLAVLALILVVGIVVVALNWNNWFGGSKGGDNDGGKTVIVDPEDIPEDPDEYFAYLHEAQAAGFSKSFSKGFLAAFSGETQGAMSVEAELKVTLGKQLLGILEDALAESGMEMDVDWLKTISLIMNSNTDSNSNQSANIAIAIGKQKIVSIDAIMDNENMVYYMGVPELSKKYVKMDMGDMMDSASMISSADMMALIMENMPSDQEMEKLVDGYMDIIAKYLDGAERREGTLVAGDGSEDVTGLTVTITEEELAKMIQEILEYTKENKTSRKIVQAIIDAAEEMYAENLTMEEFEDFMDEGIEAMGEIIAEAEEGNYIELTVFANLAEIRGYDILVYSDGAVINSANFYFVHDGSKIYVDMQVNADYSHAQVEGVLTKKSGKLSGELALEIDGDELGTLELKNVTSEGYGTYVITPNPVLLDELGMDEMISSFISEASFEIEIKKDGLAVTVVNDKGALITLDLTASTGKGSKVTFPSNTSDSNDPDDMESWAMSLDYGKLLDNLKKAGLPNDLYKMLKQLLG